MILWNAYYEIHTVKCILWYTYCEMHIVKCILLNTYCEMQTVECIRWQNIHWNEYSLIHTVKCILWNAYCEMHPVKCIFEAMIVRRPLLVCCTMRNYLKQLCSMYLRLHSQRTSYHNFWPKDPKCKALQDLERSLSPGYCLLYD